MRIFVSGGCALGKSTFCQSVSDALGIEYITNFMRNVLARDELTNKSFLERQSALENEFIKLHHTSGSFIIDRSYLDVSLWTYHGTFIAREKEAPQSVIDLVASKLSFLEDDVIIVLPSPTKNHYYENVYDNIINDPIRYKSYSEVIGSGLGKSDFIDKLYSITDLLTRDMLRVVTAAKAQNNNFWVLTPKLSKNYYDWQSITQEMIINIQKGIN